MARGEDLPLVVGEPRDPLGEERVTLGAALLEEALALLGDLDPHDAAVVGVDRAPHERVLLEPRHDARHARRLHLLDRRELTEGDGAHGVDGVQRGEPGRREVVALARALLADPAGQAGHGEPETRCQPGG